VNSQRRKPSEKLANRNGLLTFFYERFHKDLLQLLLFGSVGRMPHTHCLQFTRLSVVILKLDLVLVKCEEKKIYEISCPL
jgi:hypothetical protein